MYSRIIDPETNKEYGLNSTHGIAVLTNYISSLKDFTTKRQQLGGDRRSMVLPDDDEFNVPLNMYRAQTRGVNNGDEPFVEESIRRGVTRRGILRRGSPRRGVPRRGILRRGSPRRRSPQKRNSPKR